MLELPLQPVLLASQHLVILVQQQANAQLQQELAHVLITNTTMDLLVQPAQLQTVQYAHIMFVSSVTQTTT